MSGDSPIVKTIFIVVKILLVVVFLLMGMRANYIRTKRFNSVFKIFLVNIFILIGLSLYEFVPYFQQKILPLYICLVMVGVSHIASIHAFINKAKQYQKKEITQEMMKILYMMYGMHFILLSIAPMPVVGAYCLDEIIYPICFMGLLYSWLIMSFVARKWRIDDYYMDSNVLLEIQNLETEMNASQTSLLDGQNGNINQSEKEEKKVFTNAEILRQMMDMWHKFEDIIRIVVIIILVMAHAVNNFGFVEFLNCKRDENGLIIDNDYWTSSYMAGKLFGILHVVVMMMTTVQAERAFYSIPHKIGYIDGDVVRKIKKSIDEKKHINEYS